MKFFKGYKPKWLIKYFCAHEWKRERGWINLQVCKLCGKIREG